MNAWILIIILSGWGAGTDSAGNAIATVEFTSKERCEAAAKALADNSASKMWTICSEK